MAPPSAHNIPAQIVQGGFPGGGVCLHDYTDVSFRTNWIHDLL